MVLVVEAWCCCGRREREGGRRMEVEEKGERERDCPKKLLMPPSFFLSLVRSSLGLSFSCPFDAREREKRVECASWGKVKGRESECV